MACWVILADDSPIVPGCDLHALEGAWLGPGFVTCMLGVPKPSPVLTVAAPRWP